MATNAASAPRSGPELPVELDRRFEAVIFDWDGTAVTDRAADGTAARRVIEALCNLGFDVAVVTGTNIKNVDPQLAARPSGPGGLHLCLNRGSEVFSVGPSGPQLVWRREATDAEERALDEAARLSIERLGKVGLRAEVVSQRLNRRKVDIIPEPEWADPPKARIGELLTAVEQRLSAVGLGGLAEVVDLCEQASRDAGLADPKITSDVKHIEIGLTDKADSARWILGELGRRGIVPADVLIAGDELGPIGDLPGSDSFMLVPESAGAVTFSVGVEPNGVPNGVVHLSGGPQVFLSVLDDQLARRRDGEAPRVHDDPEWSVVVDGIDRPSERVRQSVLSVSDGLLGTSGTTVLGHPASGPLVLPAGVYDGKGAASRLLGSPVWNRLDAELPKGANAAPCGRSPLGAGGPGGRLPRRKHVPRGLLQLHRPARHRRASRRGLRGGLAPGIHAPAAVEAQAHAGRREGQPPLGRGRRRPWRRRRGGDRASDRRGSGQASGATRRLRDGRRPTALGCGGAGRARAGRGCRLRAVARRAPDGLERALGRCRRADRGRSPPPAGGAVCAVPPAQLRGRDRRGGGRRPRADRSPLPRTCLLGYRDLRPPIPRRDPSCSRPRHPRVPPAATRPGSLPRARLWPPRGPLPVGISALGP